MKRALLAMMCCAWGLAGCNQGELAYTANKQDKTVVEVEHVLVGYMRGQPGSMSGTGNVPTEPVRRLLVTPDFVLIEDYAGHGHAEVMPMRLLKRLTWKPNPDPPEEAGQTEQDE